MENKIGFDIGDVILFTIGFTGKKYTVINKKYYPYMKSSYYTIKEFDISNAKEDTFPVYYINAHCVKVSPVSLTLFGEK